ncbi:MAG: SUMF1/EgtB/PvdO family nonheme iron enzyme, partial [Akkermansiaceae bacterium]
MKRYLLIIPILFGIAMAAEELPNPHLLPTTKAIYDKIIAKQKAEAAKHEAYTQEVPLAAGSKSDLIPIPAGKYKIGSAPASPAHKSDEAPQKEIAIPAFWMAKLETTWDIYRPYMENGKARNKDGTLNRDADMSTSEKPEIKDGET